ncbi:MAG: aminopeptidase [Phycisphaeraceae bacterium]|nr:aminopeptidase [Phycisphaeraceae bacterium]
MRDQRLNKLAQVLVEYSTGVKAGQIVRISGDPVGLPLMEAIYERCLEVGAHPFLKVSPESISEFFFEHATEDQLKYVSPLALHEVETIDVSIGLWAETNTKGLSRVDPKRQGINSAARKPIFKIFMDRAAKKADEPGKLYWCGTLYPTLASAQDAEMSLRQYEDFVFNAGHLDKPDPVGEWKKIHASQEKLREFLQGKKVIRFQTARGTDLTVNVEGSTWINCAGHENFPDGEVFTGPNLHAADGGVNGIVCYSFPAVHHGREVHDIELTFERGRVVNAKASKNEDFLIQMLDQDAGARNLGEIAIGTNYNITEYSKNTLFDEKIGGTFHAAVGAGYPESGNTNESGLHWDMVCDLRSPAGGGTITVDGQVISRDGKFLFPGWPGNL